MTLNRKLLLWIHFETKIGKIIILNRKYKEIITSKLLLSQNKQKSLL